MSRQLTQKYKISVVIPIFDAELTLENLIKNILAMVKPFASSCEIILIDDFSSDNSWNIIKSLSINNKNIYGIKMANNYGVDKAISAGLKKSSGDYIYITTCDMQDTLDKMEEMLQRIINDKSVDIVCSFFINKHPESLITRFNSMLYWRFFSFFTTSIYPEEEGLYRLLSRRAVDFYLNNKSNFPHIKILNNTGLVKKYVEMNQLQRPSGESGYNLTKKIMFGVDYITSYSYVPLIFSAVVSFALSMLGFLLGLTFIALKIIGITILPGWTALAVIISFFFSMLFFTLSIFAIYLSKNIEASKNQKSYFISEES